MNKKRVFILFDKLPTVESGGLVATYERLVKLLNDDFEFHIISVFNSGLTNDERFPNIKIHNLSRVNTFINYALIKKYIKAKKYFSALHILLSIFFYFIYIPVARLKTRYLINKEDVVIVSSPMAAIFISKKIKFILEVHSSFDYFWSDNLVGKIQSKLMRTPTLALFRTKHDMVKARSKFNSYYIYNFFDNSDLNEELLIGSKVRKNKIIYVGRLGDPKNPYKLLKCAELLKQQLPSFVLDIYGEGRYKDDIEKYIKEHDLDENVFLKGFNSDKNIYNHYSALWLTSDFEGFPLVIVEAKANGIPVITTNWGKGVFEVINNGVDGYIEHEAEAIVEKTLYLLNNEEKLLEMSKKSLESYHLFGKETAYENWMYIIEQFSKGNYEVFNDYEYKELGEEYAQE